MEINVALSASCFKDFSCCIGHRRHHVAVIEISDCVQLMPALTAPPLQGY